MTDASALGDALRSGKPRRRRTFAQVLRRVRSEAAPIEGELRDLVADAKARERAADPSHPLVAGLKPFELAGMVRQRLIEDKDYARNRRWVWRNLASASMVLTLLLSAATTIVLGLSSLGPLGTMGFVCSALVTVMIAIEPLFDWRARRASADDALKAWDHLEENLAIYVASTPAKDLDQEVILGFDKDRRAIWSKFSDQ
ncbi:MAG TPA: hypothetical protein VG650_15905 [Mycobacteriales bacterium]|nr:hypothetical protein [Mycobacteriales bacterium]